MEDRDIVRFHLEIELEKSFFCQKIFFMVSIEIGPFSIHITCDQLRDSKTLYNMYIDLETNVIHLDGVFNIPKDILFKYIQWISKQTWRETVSLEEMFIMNRYLESRKCQEYINGAMTHYYNCEWSFHPTVKSHLETLFIYLEFQDFCEWIDCIISTYLQTYHLQFRIHQICVGALVKTKDRSNLCAKYFYVQSKTPPWLVEPLNFEICRSK